MIDFCLCAYYNVGASGMEPPVMQNKNTFKGENTMKKRRLAIACFVLVACLVMGIGYAALSHTFTIETKASMTPDLDNFPMEITKAQLAVGGAAPTNTVDGSTASISAGKTAVAVKLASTALSKVGDSVTLTVTVANLSTKLKADMQAPSVTSNAASDFISVEVGSYSRQLLEADDGNDLTTNNTTTITFTFTLTDPPLETVSEAIINIEFIANAVEITTP